MRGQLWENLIQSIWQNEMLTWWLRWTWETNKVTTHPEVEMNVCTRSDGNLSNSHWLISLNFEKKTKLENRLPLRFILLQPRMFANTFEPFYWVDDIPHDKWKLWLAGSTTERVRGSSQPVGFILWGPWFSEQNYTKHTHTYIYIYYCACVHVKPNGSSAFSTGQTSSDSDPRCKAPSTDHFVDVREGVNMCACL